MAIPASQNYQEGVYLRPNNDIDPKLKATNPTYALNWSQYIFSQYQTGAAAIKPGMLARFAKNRSYAEGRQNTQIYKDWIFGKADDAKPTIPVVDKKTKELVSNLVEENLAEKNLNFDEVFSPLPKYISNIIGIMQTQEHDITVDAEDENSGTLREEMKFGSWIRQELKPILERFNATMQIPDPTEQQVKPKSLEELELFENIGAFKLPYEIAMEKALSHTEFISKYEKQVKENVVADLATIGYTSTVTFTDPDTGKVKHKWKDVEDVILEDSKLEDYSDSTWGGYIEYYTINQLRAETGIKEDELFNLAYKYKNAYGNNTNISAEKLSGGQYNYNDNRVPVLHSYWKSIDTEYYTQRNTNGKTVTYYEPYRSTKKGRSVKPKIYNKENRKTTKTDFRRLYHAKWVIDSDYVFNYGVVTNTPYNYGMNDVEFPISMYRIKGKPLIEIMIPIADQIFLTYIKLQSSIAKAPPPGLAINMDAMDNVTWGNKKLHPRDNIKIYTVSGHVFYRLKPKGLPGMNNGGSVPTPVTQLKGGLGAAITDGIQGIEFLYRQLDVLTGIDGITSSNTAPSRDTGKAVTEMAIAATSNTLKPIYSGFITLKEANARCAGWMIAAGLDAFDDVSKSPYFRVLGSGNLLAIKTASKFPPTVYGFRIEARITAAEKNAMMEAAKVGLAGGKNGVPALTYSEYSFIIRHLNTGRSVKYIEMWMAKKERERQEAEAKNAQQTMLMQAQQNKEQEEAKRQSELQKMEAEKQKEIAIVQAKGEQERLTLKEKYKYESLLVNKQHALKMAESSKEPAQTE